MWLFPGAPEPLAAHDLIRINSNEKPYGLLVLAHLCAMWVAMVRPDAPHMSATWGRSPRAARLHRPRAGPASPSRGLSPPQRPSHPPSCLVHGPVTLTQQTRGRLCPWRGKTITLWQGGRPYAAGTTALDSGPHAHGDAQWSRRRT